MQNIPANLNLTLYHGDTFSYLFQIEENGSPFDLTQLHDVTFSFFNKNVTAFEHSLSGGEMSITGTDNDQLSGKADKATMEPDTDDYYVELNEPAISRMQGKVLLHRKGLLEDVKAYIQDSGAETQLAWEEATVWKRFSPMIEGLAQEFNIDIDQFFSEAKQIEL